jgi:hypothetical protein
MTNLPDLDSRFARLADVVRWEGYDNDAFDLRAQDHHRVGFDADDRVIATLEYSGFLGGRLCYETFRT